MQTKRNQLAKQAKPFKRSDPPVIKFTESYFLPAVGGAVVVVKEHGRVGMAGRFVVQVTAVRTRAKEHQLQLPRARVPQVHFHFHAYDAQVRWDARFEERDGRGRVLEAGGAARVVVVLVAQEELRLIDLDGHESNAPFWNLPPCTRAPSSSSGCFLFVVVRAAPVCIILLFTTAVAISVGGVGTIVHVAICMRCEMVRQEADV